MAEQPPKITTTVRLAADLHRRVADAAESDHRSFNNEVVALVEAALDDRDRAKADR